MRFSALIVVFRYCNNMLCFFFKRLFVEFKFSWNAIKREGNALKNCIYTIPVLCRVFKKRRL